MSTIITVENLSKRYFLNHRYEENATLRDSLVNQARQIGHRITGRPNPYPPREEFWALKDVSFEISQGERVGIIGRNGAGKSTLLKVLSRITDPTTGRVTLKGRVASLLEVGTGFHPELTGRENIFLNGAILGMSRQEIERKFDEIVAFAEIDRFLDTPVKRYSSGMYVRLAFAVAAHLEPEILIVDEVLAVGDIQFQKKCLGKMEAVGQEGRTIIFVSHNMSAVHALCNKTLLLKQGMVQEFGSTDTILPLYFNNGQVSEHDGLAVRAYTEDGSEWEANQNLTIEITWDKYRFKPGWEADIAVYTLEGIKLFAVQSSLVPGFSSIDPEANAVRFQVKNPGFSERDIRIDVGVREKPGVPYKAAIENALFVMPAAGSLQQFVHQRVDEGIVFPSVSVTSVSL